MILTDYIGRFRSRKAHVYCIGAAKTGTTSVAHIFNGFLRAAHEPNVSDTTKLVIRYLDDKLTKEDCVAALRQRDKKLNLELESSHPLGYFAPYLVKAFPDAKFVVTIRHPRSWLRSRLNFHMYRKPDEWSEYRDFIWSRHHHEYAKEERCLKENGLYSLDAYLCQYSEQYRIIFDSIPESKRIVVKTSEISSKLNEISQFIGVNNKKIKPYHTNKMDVEESVFDDIDGDFIDQSIDDYCGWIINEFFSDKENDKC